MEVGGGGMRPVFDVSTGCGAGPLDLEFESMAEERRGVSRLVGVREAEAPGEGLMSFVWECGEGALTGSAECARLSYHHHPH
jgi:hypothetical protein